MPRTLRGVRHSDIRDAVKKAAKGVGNARKSVVADELERLGFEDEARAVRTLSGSQFSRFVAGGDLPEDLRE